MFMGRYEHTLDDKGRLTLPSNYAGELAAGVVLVGGFERCLQVYPEAEFRRRSAMEEQMPITDSKARKFRRLWFSRAHPVQPDRQRRILIPQWLRDHAGISDRVLIVGAASYAELWDPETWQLQEQELEGDLQDADYFMSLSV